MSLFFLQMYATSLLECIRAQLDVAKSHRDKYSDMDMRYQIAETILRKTEDYIGKVAGPLLNFVDRLLNRRHVVPESKSFIKIKYFCVRLSFLLKH